MSFRTLFSRVTGAIFLLTLGMALLAGSRLSVGATPANGLALEKFYGRFLAKRLDTCTTCHLPTQADKPPANLHDFPHNTFGHRLAVLGETLRKTGQKADIATRLRLLAHEDSDGDGVENETELLLGHAPGDASDTPKKPELANAPRIRAEFARFLASYRWEPFENVKRPIVPTVKNKLQNKLQNTAWNRNPIDAFIADEHTVRHLTPRPPASKAILLRRVMLDLTGLSPTPEELHTFVQDTSPNAYEKVVDRLLASPRYGERWGRHWMDVWRYSDWAGWADGNQIRDSQPFIWRWRDWIVESLNTDKGYDRMVQEMLAADELIPGDPNALRATGFLVRNYKLLSREQWMEDTVNHTSRAFLGITMHCAKCHDHKYDPFTQAEYYHMRAVFEPYNVRTDRLPGQPDITKDGLVHIYDADPKVATYLFVRGDERNPDKTAPMLPGIPSALGGTFDIKPVPLLRTAFQPDKRDFVIQETVAAADYARAANRTALETAKNPGTTAEQRKLLALNAAVSEAQYTALLAVLRVEKLEDTGQKETAEWKQAAQEATSAQRKQAVASAERDLFTAQQALSAAQATPSPPAVANSKQPGKPVVLETLKTRVAEVEKVWTAAKSELAQPSSVAYKPRIITTFPTESSGRRLAFARWITEKQNPLTARVAMNQIWMRHFGVGLVPSVADFGRNGRPPSHPKLLDWLASEFMTHNWQMKPMHRLIVTSAAYRMASTFDPTDAKIDPDNTFLWRMNSRRMEAEVVRDNVLFVAGQLDETRGGPEIDHNLGLTSHRRSLYLRHAAEKQAEFLQIFDGPSVTECYERKQSVMPQQALALANSELTLVQSRILARSLSVQFETDSTAFVQEAFLRVLSRPPTAAELKLCTSFLDDQTRRFAIQPKTTAPGSPTTAASSADPMLHARESLTLVLFNHNDFVTIR